MADKAKTLQKECLKCGDIFTTLESKIRRRVWDGRYCSIDCAKFGKNFTKPERIKLIEPTVRKNYFVNGEWI